MSILEKLKQRTKAFLSDLEKASTPLPGFERTSAIAVLVDEISKLFDDSCREDFDVRSLLKAISVINNIDCLDWSDEDLENARSEIRNYIVSLKEDDSQQSIEEFKGIITLRPYFQIKAYLDSIGVPLNKMEWLHQKRGARFRKDVRSLCKQIDACPDPGDVFEALICYHDDEEAVHYIVESDYSSSEQAELTTAFLNHNKDEFRTVLAKNPIGLRSFSGLCFLHEFTHELIFTSDDSNEALRSKQEIGILASEIILDSITLEESNLSNDAKLWSDHIAALKEIISSPAQTFEDSLAFAKKHGQFIDKIIFQQYLNSLEDLPKMDPAERVIFERVLNRPEGQPYIQYLKRKFAEEEQEPEEQDDESSSPDVLQDVELLHTEPRFKFMYQYNSSFVSAAELQNKMRSGIHYKRGWKNTDIQRNSNNLYYKGAITYRPDTKDFPDEYDEVKWLYEKMVSLTAIENTPENFNSFMFRMTGKRKDNQVIIRIPWLLTANELYFWIGHIIGDSKSRIPDGTFPLSKNVFFETVKDEIEFDKPTASKVNSLDSTWRGELIPKQMFEDINKFIPEMLSTRKKIE